MDVKIDNIIRVLCDKEDDFFYYWMSFLKPIHKLNENGIRLTACFLKYRYALSKIIQDEHIIDKTLMASDSKRLIRDECGLTPAHFSVIMRSLKEKQIIVENRINPRFVPKINESKNGFQMMILFDYNK